MNKSSVRRRIQIGFASLFGLLFLQTVAGALFFSHLAKAQNGSEDLFPLRQWQFLLLTGALVLLLFTLLLAVSLMRWVVQPLRQITDEATAITGGHFSQRLSERHIDEFGELAVGFNRALDALHSARKVGEDLEARVVEQSVEIDRFFTLSLDMLTVVDFSGRLVRVSSSFEQVLGYPLSEITGKSIFNFIHPDDCPATEKELEKYRESGRPSFQFENRYRHADGSWRTFSWNAVPLVETKMIYGVARDITDVRLTENALRQSEESLSATLQSIGDALLVADAAGRIVRMNPVAEELTGRAFAQVRMRPVQDVLRLLDEEHVPVDIFASRAESDEGHTVILVSHVGTERLISYNVAPIREGHDTQSGTVIVFRDITEQKRSEARERQRMERMVHFQEALISLRDRDPSDIEAFIRKSLEDCADLLAVERASVWMLSENGEEIRCRDLFVRSERTHTADLRLVRDDYPGYFEAIASLYPLIVNDAMNHPATRDFGATYLRPFNIVSMLDIPIRSAAGLVGVLCCEQTDEPREWQPDEVEFVSRIASGIFLGMESNERASAQDKLRLSEQYNRSIVESSQDCLKVLTLDGRLLSMGEKGQQLMAVEDFLEIEGRDWPQFWDPEYREAAREAVSEARMGGTGRFQGVCRTMKGELKWWDVQISSISDVNGNPRRLLAVSRDITIQREIEEQLREMNSTLEEKIQRRTSELVASEERFRLMIEQLQDYAIFLLDPSGIVATWNAGAERFKGYEAAEIVGRHYSCFHQFEDIQGGLPERLLAEAISTGRVRHEGWRMRKNGSRFWAEVTLTAIRDATGELRGFAKVTRDLTERRDADIALQQSLETQRELTRKALAGQKAKSDFLATMSHELRTPMNGVIGYADLLARSTDLRGPNREYADILVQSAQSLLRILDDILDFSGLEAGSLKIENGVFSPRRLINDVQLLLAPAANRKNLEIEVNISQGIPSAMVGDAGRIRQVLLNLVGNAVKFTETGSVTISLDPTEGGREWKFQVRDTGPGLSPHQHEAIFEPFVQADSSSSRRHGGTGLGLAISKKLVELMGGSLSVESALGEGCTFTLMLPLKTISGPSRQEIVAEMLEDEEFASRYPLKILVVEDDPVNLKLILTLLRKLGYDPLAASNGVEGVAKFREYHPQCILMDIQMPEMDGIEATKAIRGIEAATESRRVFIAALTANTNESDRQRCFDAGMSSHLNKPLRRSHLYSALMEASTSANAGDHI